MSKLSLHLGAVFVGAMILDPDSEVFFSCIIRDVYGDVKAHIEGAYGIRPLSLINIAVSSGATVAFIFMLDGVEVALSKWQIKRFQVAKHPVTNYAW